MSTTHDQMMRCTVYGGHGVATERIAEHPSPDPEVPYHGPVADHTSLRTLMTRDLVCARADLDIAAVVSLVIGRHVGCVPVVDERGRPVGVITKFDLVEQLEAAMRGSRWGCPLPPDLRAETADDVMMPVALTLREHATIGQAAAMMMSEDTHHVLVVDETGVLIGVVSSKDIVAWVAKNDGHVTRRAHGTGAPYWRPLEG
jgi:CBS-domain-containing membrane protein